MSDSIVIIKNNKKIKSKINKLKPWYYNVHLPDGTHTFPEHPLGDFPNIKWKEIAPNIPENLSGLTVLDVGCNAGFYSFELAKRGAEVFAIDDDNHYLKQAKWLAKELELNDRITFKQMQVYDLARIKMKFNFIWFMGEFNRLRYPLLALDILADKVKNLLVFQTLTMPGNEVVLPPADFGFKNKEVMLEAGWPKMAFIEHEFANNHTNWWAPNKACIEAMLRSAGFRPKIIAGNEIFICEPDTPEKAPSQKRNQSGDFSSIQKNWKNISVKKNKK